MKIKIPLVFKEGTNLIQYPEDENLFKNGLVEDGSLICDYSGESTEYEEYTEVFYAPAKMTHLEFMNLVGDANMIALYNLADTDNVAKLILQKLTLANYVDYEDGANGPQTALAYFRSLGDDIMTEAEYQRILTRQYA